jgi:hypothetical protein
MPTITNYLCVFRSNKFYANKTAKATLQPLSFFLSAFAAS